MVKKIMASFHPVLLWTSIIHFGFAIVFAVLLIFDQREVLNIPLWIKPIKFAISIAVYTFTLAYLVPFLQSINLRKLISVGTSIAMFVEMGLITMQAAKGTLSHYNYESAFGIMVYSIMGVFIAFASVLLVLLGIGFIRYRPVHWSKSFYQAVHMSIWTTVVGTVIGGYMSALTGHSVGGQDGGPGLPFLNWSTAFGDWRVAHFIGLHGLQIFLVLGGLLRNRASAVFWQWLMFALYSAILLISIVLTIMGQPVIGS
jgi:hypothetical protein